MDLQSFAAIQGVLFSVLPESLDARNHQQYCGIQKGHDQGRTARTPEANASGHMPYTPVTRPRQVLTASLAVLRTCRW